MTDRYLNKSIYTMNMKTICKNCGAVGGDYSSLTGVFHLTNKIDEYLCHRCDTMVRDDEYEAGHTVYTEEGYRDIKCKNYEICEGTFDYRLVGSSFGIPGCKNYEYLCRSCYMSFGKWKGSKGHLPIHDAVECPVCLETKRGTEQPKCEHVICIQCFRDCYYGIFKEPEFPYSADVERQCEEYDDEYPMEFIEKYPLLIEYDAEYLRRLRAQEDMSRTNSRCPVCRK